MIGKKQIFPGAFKILFCILAAGMSCSFHTGYENVRLVKEKGVLYFYPDHAAPREPMPLNIRTSFAGINDKWGILFSVPYRETGFGAINRTLFTTVVYFTVVDHELNQLFKRPVMIYKKEGPVIRDFFGADHGFGAAYLTRENYLICCLYDDKEPLNVKARYKIADGSKVLSSDGSSSDLAIAFYKGDLFTMVYDKNLKLVRVHSDGSMEEILINEVSGKPELLKNGDLYIDERGVYALWWGTSIDCKNSGCSSFYYASCSLKDKVFVKQKLQVSGDSSEELKARFAKKGSALVIFVQYGNQVWEGEIGTSKNVQSLHKLISLGKSKYPPSAMFACTSKSCYVFFQKSDGPYIFSKEVGLRRSMNIQYRRAVCCSGEECIQETSDKGISVLNLK